MFAYDCNRVFDLSVCILLLNSWLLSKSEFYNNGTTTTRIKGICKIQNINKNKLKVDINSVNL